LFAFVSAVLAAILPWSIMPSARALHADPLGDGLAPLACVLAATGLGGWWVELTMKGGRVRGFAAMAAFSLCLAICCFLAHFHPLWGASLPAGASAVRHALGEGWKGLAWGVLFFAAYWPWRRVFQVAPGRRVLAIAPAIILALVFVPVLIAVIPPLDGAPRETVGKFIGKALPAAILALALASLLNWGLWRAFKREATVSSTAVCSFGVIFGAIMVPVMVHYVGPYEARSERFSPAIYYAVALSPFGFIYAAAYSATLASLISRPNR
jgi:hypothetical protein